MLYYGSKESLENKAMQTKQTALKELRQLIAEKRATYEEKRAELSELEKEISLLEGRLDGLIDSLGYSDEELTVSAEPSWNKSRYLPINKKNPEVTSKKILVLLDEAGEKGMTTQELREAIKTKKRWSGRDIADSTLQTTLTRMNKREISKKGKQWVLNQDFDILYE